MNTEQNISEKPQTITEAITKLSDSFTHSTRAESGETFYHLRHEIDRDDWRYEIIRAGHLDHLPDDQYYETIMDVIGEFSDAVNDRNAECLDDLRDLMGEIADNLVDIYIPALTNWLHKAPGNVQYITEAAQEFGTRDGIQLLQQAQYLWFLEIGYALINAIEEITEEA